MSNALLTFGSANHTKSPENKLMIIYLFKINSLLCVFIRVVD